MGWCSATTIFDMVVEPLLKSLDENVKIEVIESLVKELENNDWDCQMESAYWDHPIVQKVFKKLHPKWFDEEGWVLK